MYTVENCFEQIKEMFFPTKPKWEKLTFTKEAWMKLMCYINLIGDYEITGFGRVIDNTIVDVKILKQEVKSTTVDCNTSAMQEFLLNTPRDQMGQWILDWHSHVNMSVFASGTDTANYEEQWKARLKNQYPVLIVNKKQEVYSKCYISPARQDDIKVYISSGEVTEERLLELYNECKKDVEENCTKYVAKTTYGKQTTMFPYSTYNSYDDYDSTDYYSRWENGNSNYIDLSNVKKKGLANTKSAIKEELCVSCYTELTDNEEIERHICDDCWETMTPSEKASWILNMK